MKAMLKGAAVIALKGLVYFMRGVAIGTTFIADHASDLADKLSADA